MNCSVCGSRSKVVCDGCRTTSYCSSQCSNKDFKAHAKLCESQLIAGKRPLTEEEDVDDSTPIPPHAHRAIVASQMGKIHNPEDWSRIMVDDLLGKWNLYRIFDMPRSSWPFFTEYKDFWYLVAREHFRKIVNSEDFNPAMGEKLESGMGSVAYYPNKRKDQSLRDYIVENREMLKD